MREAEGKMIDLQPREKGFYLVLFTFILTYSKALLLPNTGLNFIEVAAHSVGRVSLELKIYKSPTQDKQLDLEVKQQ